MDQTIWGQLILIVVLTLVNAFFAGAEMAIVSANKQKMRGMATAGNQQAKLLMQVLAEPSSFLSTIQVGITLAGFFSSASAAVGLSDDFAGWLSQRGVPFASKIAFIGITVLLSYIILVFGELVPKRLALQNANQWALKVVRPIRLFSKVMRPFVALLALSTNALLYVFGRRGSATEEKITLEEIKALIHTGREQGVINASEKAIIDRVVMFDEKVVESIMTPRTEVIAVEVNHFGEEQLTAIIESGYSRIPVYQKRLDNIIGVLHFKDLMVATYGQEINKWSIRELLRPAMYVPEHQNVDGVFREMQANKNHMAILIDEYGGFSGIVTMEDLLEEIVGDIHDEHDKDVKSIQRLAEGAYEINGALAVETVNQLLSLKIPVNSEYYDSVGGFLIHHLGHLPEEGDEWEDDDMVFKVVEMEGRRITRLEINCVDKT